MRRAFSLVELLVVVAILAVLAALLFPVFARAKARAKLTDCGSRLRQFAVALNLYRADHDDRGYVWGARDDGLNAFRYPFNIYEGMKGYLGDGTVLWCPEPNAAPPGALWNQYAYRAFSQRREGIPGVRLHVPARPVPGTVVAYCTNHTRQEFDPRFRFAVLRVGTYPFVREDTSAGIAPSDAVGVGYYDDAGWYDEPDARRSWQFRFPGEPWPPTPE